MKNLTIAIVAVVTLANASSARADVMGLEEYNLIIKVLDEKHQLVSGAYISSTLVDELLSATPKYSGADRAAVYGLAFADPDDDRVRSFLETKSQGPAMYLRGMVAWARFQQTIRGLTADQQVAAYLSRLATTQLGWERVMIAAHLGLYPRSRLIGEALLNALVDEISQFRADGYYDRGPIDELTFQLSRYTDMDLLERAMPILEDHFFRRPGIHLYGLSVQFLNLITTGRTGDPRIPNGFIRAVDFIRRDIARYDQCPGTLPENIANEAGCSIGQLCPPCGSWKNHGEFVSCVAQAANDFVAAGYIPAWQHGQIVSAAARSDVGKPHDDGAGCAEVDVDAHR